MTVSIRFFRFTIGLLIALLLFVAPHSFVEAANQTTAKTTKEYLISFKQNAQPQNILKTRKVKHQQKGKFQKQNTIIVELDQEELAQLRADANVAFIEPNSEVSIQNIEIAESTATEGEGDIVDSLSWGNVAIGANMLVDEDMKGDGVKIAILDTGISSHLDLNIAGGTNFVEGVTGYADDNGHGTHVAGTIAAKDNNSGIVGIAPGASIYAVKVLKANGTGTYAQVIQGIEWAIENHMDIISMSFTGADESEALHQAIQEANDAGIVLVAAAGNLGAGTETEMYPALFDEVISVGASTQSNVRANLSSTGSQLDLVAPGVDIYSTSSNGGYEFRSGTSMAVPHVTASAAVLLSKYPEMDVAGIKNLLYSSATVLGTTHEYGHGLVNLAKAMGVVDSALPPFDVNSSDDTLPEAPGAGEVSISSITRGASFNLSTTTPSYPAGVTKYTKLVVGVDGPSSVRKCEATYVTSYSVGSTAPSPALSCSTSSSWPLGAYDVKFTFFYSGGTITITNTFALEPEAPTVTIGTRTRTSIAFTWNPVNDIKSYKILKGGTLVGTTAGTSYTLSNLSPSTSYLIQVKAVYPDDSNSGVISSPLYASTLAPLTAPNAPSVTNATANSFYVSWNSVSGVSNYKILIDGALYSTVSTTGATVSGLNPNTPYSVQVKAVDPYDSTSGAISPVTTAYTTKAAGPTGLSSSFVTTNTIKVKWDAVSGATSYTVIIIKPTGTLSYNVTTNVYTFSGLVAGTTYTIQVNANNSLVSQISVVTEGKGALPATIPLSINGTIHTARPSNLLP
ncbi:S8 family serine peptidase [Cohnella fermenti]|uniref:Fibronectin type-III domain-containing protein n=1 Tax=Cohnella fermenti TaxID=2565925 RepID=A0A4V3WDY2_9BACL|nr:S8 family serine peptidase [Cohnella fermenti]THF74057.1 hypothetical protein E6C55_26570 [Cohnella fermenti]